jgi:hypothetical protein
MLFPRRDNEYAIERSALRHKNAGRLNQHARRLRRPSLRIQSARLSLNKLLRSGVIASEACRRRLLAALNGAASESDHLLAGPASVARTSLSRDEANHCWTSTAQTQVELSQVASIHKPWYPLRARVNNLE